MSTAWNVEVDRGSAAEFHARDIPNPLIPTLWWFDVQQPALVLGSAQPIGHIDVVACERAGVDIVRRRSGGGAVLLEPDDVLWVDVVIPAGDPRWSADVSSSAWWLGEVWQRTLVTCGIDGTTVHHGPMVHRRWSDRLCFAGLGGGEVVAADGRKIVGISQRRTRAGARFQCALYRRWRAENHAPLFAEPGPQFRDLDDIVFAVDRPVDELRAVFTAALHQT